MAKWDYKILTSSEYRIGTWDERTKEMKIDRIPHDPSVDCLKNKLQVSHRCISRIVWSDTHRHWTTLEEELRTLGSQGWELVGGTPPLASLRLSPGELPRGFQLIFKRPMSDE